MVMLSSKIISTIEDFLSLKRKWNILLGNSHSENIHLTFDWLFTWWKYFSGNKRSLFVILFFEETRIIGIAPLMKERTTFKKFVPWNRILFLGDPESDWHDFIIAEKRHLVIKLMFDILIKENVSEIILHNIPESSLNLPFLRAYDKGPYTVVKKQTRCYYVNTKKQWEYYYKNETSKKFVRQDIRRLHNRLSLDQCYFKESNFENIRNDLNMITLMHQMSQRRKERTSFFSEKKYYAFFKDIIEIWAKNNQVRLFYLLINEIPVAYVLGFYYNKIFYYYNIGFNTDYKKYSPSKLLLYELIKILFHEECVELNFMRGDSDYKRRWTKDFRINYQIKWFNNNGFSGLINKYRSLI